MLSNTLLADFLTREGRETSVEDSMRLFMGRRWTDNLQRIALHLGAPLSQDFEERYRAFARPRMRRDVVAVAGVIAFIRSFAHLRHCIASSSGLDWLQHTIERFGLAAHFADRMFSGTEVVNGKPAPDLFLLAAERMRARPSHTLVIEDSPAGIEAARAAGMIAIGMTAASHAQNGLGERLLQAGAHHVSGSFEALAARIAST
jgi:HAD superfamily hydrolase (TIGR01509 family)